MLVGGSGVPDDVVDNNLYSKVYKVRVWLMCMSQMLGVTYVVSNTTSRCWSVLALWRYVVIFICSPITLVNSLLPSTVKDKFIPRKVKIRRTFCVK